MEVGPSAPPITEMAAGGFPDEESGEAEASGAVAESACEEVLNAVCEEILNAA